MSPSSRQVFEVAGTPCELASKDPKLLDLLHSYAPFATERSPRFSVEVTFHDDPVPPFEPSPNGLYAQLNLDHDQLSISGPGFEGGFDFGTHHGTIVQPLDLAPCETFLAAILGWYLRKADGFFLHAAALQSGENALVFFGPSGSGKTTLATAVGEGVLSDEIVAVRRDGNEYRVYGVPWRGSARSGRLAGCFSLQKASATRVQPLSRTGAVRKLLPSVFYTTPNAEELGQTFTAIGELTQSIPCFALDFTPDRSAWEQSLMSIGA